MDPVSLPAATTVFGLFKKLQDIGKKLQNAELNNIIADLQMRMADLKMENAELKNEVVDLKADLESKDMKVTLGRWGYYTDDDGAFCVPCYDSKTQLHRLRLFGNGFSFCPICSSKGNAGSYVNSHTSNNN